MPVKNEEEAYEKIMDMSNNNDYATGNLLDFVNYKENYRLIATDLSKQTKLKDPQQISFIDKILNTHGATMFFIIKKSKETSFSFSQNSATMIDIMETQKIVHLLNGFDNKKSNFATKNGSLLTVNQKVIIQKTTQQNF